MRTQVTYALQITDKSEVNFLGLHTIDRHTHAHSDIHTRTLIWWHIALSVEFSLVTD